MKIAGKQKLEEDLRQKREHLICCAIQCAMGTPDITHDASREAKIAFRLAAYELADYLIREQEEKRFRDSGNPNLMSLKSTGWTR